MRNQKQIRFDSRYPSVESLRTKARSRIPGFAFDYLDRGCNEEVNLKKNTSQLRKVELLPRYTDPFQGADLATTLFGTTYAAPFGVAPVGLQGLMWPNATEILAEAAFRNNLPFILSTVATASIEKIAELTQGEAWFQLYHPTELAVRDDLIQRLKATGYKVLVLLCDTPTFGFRPKEIQNGLAMPPKMTSKNILQILGRPNWALQTLKYGTPEFKTLKPYMPENLNLKQLGLFMDQTFDKRMSRDKIAAIRDLWPGKLVLKGVATEADAEAAIALGLDGLIVSNHGGRQLDAGEATIWPTQRIAKSYGDKITVMMDSGLRSGPDIARTLACGAEFAFLGRAFMYAVAALGQAGGDHIMSLLQIQLQQVLEQIGCSSPNELPNFLKA